VDPRRLRSTTVITTIAVTLILVLSEFVGLAQGASGKHINLTGMRPLALAIGQSGTIEVNITNGTVSSLYPYEVYWFPGAANATAVSAAYQSIPAPAGCTLKSKCPTVVQAFYDVAYNRPGSYDVSVTVYDGKYGNYTIGTDVVTVYDSIALCFAESSTQRPPTTLHATEGNNIIALDAQAQSKSPATYTWNFGDGNSSHGQTVMSNGHPCTNDQSMNQVTHHYYHSGTYLITLTVSDVWGFAVRKYAFVNVTDPPIGVAISGPGHANQYANVTFAAAPSTPVGPDSYSWNTLTFVWNFGDGTNNFTSALNSQNCTPGPTCYPDSTISHTFNTTGAYTVKVWVTDGEDQAGRFTNGTSSMVVHVSALTLPLACTWSHPQVVGNTLPFGATAGCGVGTSGPQLNESTDVTGFGNVYGTVQNIPLLSYGTPSYPITFRSPTGSVLVNTSASFSVTDPGPLVGLSGVYVEVNVSLSLSACTFRNVTLTVLEGGVTPIATGYLGSICGTPSPPSGPPTINLAPVELYFGNNYSVHTSYLPYGSGSAVGTLTLAYGGTGATPHAANWNFVNSNPSTYNWTVYTNPDSVGEPAFIRTEMFSLADTSLTTTWNFGDNSQPFTFTSPAPSTAEPSLSYYTVEHLWASGHAYPLDISTKDPVVQGRGGLTGQEAVTVTESGAVAISDSAPLVQISGGPASLRQDIGGEWNVSTTSLDSGASGHTPSCQFGDGNGTSGSTLTHAYAYSGTYFIVCYSGTAGGSVGVNFTLAPVRAASPVATFFFHPPVPSNNAVVTFNASQSTAWLTPASGLWYAWNFGDGGSSTGFGSAGYLVQHIYPTAGVYTVLLLVSTLQGKTATTQQTIRVVATSISNGAVASVTVTAGKSHWFNVTGVTTAPRLLPNLNVTWSWGGGFGPFPTVTYGSYGLDTVHSYLIPGSYTLSATLTLPGLTQTVYYATITVKDPTPVLSLAYQGAVDYGENHSMVFNATALGTWADTVYPLTESWNFTWVWGDGTTNTKTTSTNGTTATTHTYVEVGQVALNLTVTSPWIKKYRSTLTVIDGIILVPDSDGDGLPNVLEVAIDHTNPYETSTGITPSGQQYGTGFTDYLIAMSNHLLTNLTSDPDSDGLTSAQEVFGSVTGFVSDPLDSNTAGDGIPDGSHFFTDQFPASNEVGFNATSPTVFVTIPGVEYGGVPTGFNQSRLTVQFSMAPARVAGNVSLSLIVGNSSTSAWIALPAPQNVTNTYYLLNDSPQSGPSSPYGITLGTLAVIQNWTVVVTFNSGNDPGGSGRIVAAEIADSYYTDPALADPYHQGMLEGNTLVTPIFNCSAPKNETYPTINVNTFAEKNVSYWPYTEAYYKLSEIQGIPYAKSTNSSVGASNSAACPGLLKNPGDVATYLGDEDFGISPWNAHAAGDMALTNGMKALGATAYSNTAWQYENATNGSMYPVIGTDPYLADYDGYKGSMDPTSFSDAGDGVADSQSIDPMAPIALELTIEWARDPLCTATSNGLGGAFGGQVVAYGLGSQYSETIYTPDQYNPNNGTAASCPTGEDANWTYTFDDQYLLPLNDNGSSSFSIELDLYHQLSGAIGNDTTSYLNGSTAATKKLYTPRGSTVNATGKVVSLSRIPVILFNTTGELENISGYGLRYTGERDFYAIYVNATTSSLSPFVKGPNLILESRESFLDSVLNSQLVNRTEDQSCFGSSEISSRANGSSETGIAGTWDFNLSTSGCASELLSDLKARNATGVTVGSYQVLSTSAVELLGLTNQTSALDLFESPVGWALSPLGSPPVNGPSIPGFLQTAINFLADAWLLITAFYSLELEVLVVIGQIELGFLNAIVSTCATLASKALADIESIVSYLESLAERLLLVVVSAVTSTAASVGTCVNDAFRMVLYNESQGQSLAVASKAETYTFWAQCLAGTAAVGLILAVAVAVVYTIIEGFTLGTGSLIGLVIGLVLTVLLSIIPLPNVNLGPIRATQSPPSNLTGYFESFATNVTGKPPSTVNSTSSRSWINSSMVSCGWATYGPLAQCNYALPESQVWGILGNFIVFSLDYASIPPAMKTVLDVSFKSTPASIKSTINIESFVLSTISVVLDMAALVIIPEPREFSEIGLVLGGTALIISLGSVIYQEANPEGALGPAKMEDGMALLASGTSTALSAGMYEAGY
jgi:hypothetical protein